MRLLLLVLSSALLVRAQDVSELPRVPATSPEQAAANLVVRPGFRAELMAAEPLVQDPVAICFDEESRLYVVEMRDYSERRDERLGRVKLLEDTDGDGKYDRASVFAENLPWPTSVTPWDGGVFVTAAPELLYFKDTDGDRRADVHAIIFTGFGNVAPKLNVQALPNSLQWGPDLRIHGALGGNPSRLDNFALHGSPKLELRGKDFSFDPRRMDLRPETGGGQWGMTFDEAGRKFVCSNSRHLMQVLYDERFASASKVPLSAPAVDIPVDGPQAEVFRQSPDEPWRVLRTKWRVDGTVKGIVEGGGRPSGYFTSACGVTIYRGDAYSEAFRGNAFIGDCGSNLIHRKVLEGDSGVLRARRAADEAKSEFLASKDNWFRPVALANAPDGTLWVCDMSREVVEHPWSLPEAIKSKLDLNAGNDRGRLWRIVPENFQSRAPAKLGSLGTKDLVALLTHPNGWHRDTAARLLHQRKDPAAAEALAALVKRRTPENIVPTATKTTAVPTFTPQNVGPSAEAWARFKPAITMPGDRERGKALFTARCAACHRHGGAGVHIGPDLNAMAAAGKEKVLGNILEPSREITAGYASATVKLKSGEIVAGLLANETPAGVVLRIPGSGERAIPSTDVASIERPERSLMPDGLESGLEVQAMADLLAFLCP
jgi:putative membrane-bound dehydrogenase-like protein